MIKPSAQQRPSMSRTAMIIALIIIASVSAAEARTSASALDALPRLAQQNDVGASAAAAAASAASGGRVLDVKRRSTRTGITYSVKVLLPGGRMRTMIVDGESGQVRG